MDKKIVHSVAGSGKTTLVVNKLDLSKRYLVLTYTNANFDNLCNRIRNKFNKTIPDNIFVYKFDYFVFNILFRAMFSDYYPQIKGIEFDSTKIERYVGQDSPRYWYKGQMIYNARISYRLLRDKASIIKRIQTIADCIIIDEFQDVGSRDFDLIMSFAEADIDLLYVGDFYQHTYQTSADNNYRKSLFDNYFAYIKTLEKFGFDVDVESLKNSYRCSKSICEFVSNNLGINICSNRTDETVIKEVVEDEEIKAIWYDDRIVKLHIQKASDYNGNHRNWGDVKGEDDFNDVCVILNKTSYKAFKEDKLNEIAPLTKAKLYVAITRARGNVYFIDFKKVNFC